MKNMLFFARISLSILSLVYLSACSGLKEEKALVPTIEKTSEQVAPELAYPGETGEEKEGTLFGKTIKYAEINGEAVFEGDIILSKKQLDAAAGARTEATGVSLNAQKWEKGIVYFTIEKTVTNTSAIYAAMAIIEASTPITFVYRSNQYNYVTFKNGRGFSSSIGVTGGQQFITLGLAFSKGGVLHEICHTLGLFHEHTRDDRDQTITVNFQNIAPALQVNFLTHKQSGSAGFGFDKMDLKSVMMMNSDYCSNNGQPSMTTKDGQPFTVQRTELSPNDIRCLTAMYSNIYSVSDDGLYASDTRKGKRALLSQGWVFTRAVTADPYFVYACKGGSLVRINPDNGDTKVIATGFWDVQSMVLLKGYLYVIDKGVIKKVHTETGVTTQVGSQLWLPATDIVYMEGFFYIMTKNAIFRLTPDTENFVQIAAVADARELVALNGKLYYVKTTSGKTFGIYKLDPAVGLALLFSPLFTPSAQMVSSEGSLYIADMGYLYKIEANGNSAHVSFGWTFTTQLAALNHYNY